jgi:transcriptional regulator with XRE-family HTH domain
MTHTADPDRQARYRDEIGAGFGRRLRDLRLERGMSTTALARKAGTGRTLILIAEQGNGGATALHAAAALADVLGCRRGWLCFGEGPRDP